MAYRNITGGAVCKLILVSFWLQPPPSHTCNLTPLPQLPHLSLLSAQESTHHSSMPKTGSARELTTHVATLDSWRSGGGRNWWIEAPLLTPWRESSEWHDGCSSKGPRGLNPSYPQQWIARCHILVLPFPPSLFTLSGSSLLFPEITAQSELLHANLWIRLCFLRDYRSGHREGGRMRSGNERFPD